jgi:predicted kinase
MPRLFIVTGLPYAGKSVLSRELVRRLGCGYASVDSEVVRRHWKRVPAPAAVTGTGTRGLFS